MLKCEIIKDSHRTVELEGALDEILSDTLNLIKIVYNSYLRSGKETVAGAYRQFLTQAILDPKSGVWDQNESRIVVCFDSEGDEGILQ